MLYCNRLFSKLIGAKEDGSCIAICPSTGFAITLAAHNLYRTGKIRNGERILVLQDEMSSGVYPWQELCHSHHHNSMLPFNCGLDIIPHPKLHLGQSKIGGEYDSSTCEEVKGWTEAVIQRIETINGKRNSLNKSNNDTSQPSTPRIAIACLPQIHWSDGSLLDLPKIGYCCQKHDVRLIIDATQSVGIYPINISNIPNCDLLAASVHKWLLGPHGASLVYISGEVYQYWLPLDQHERSRAVFQDEVFDARENVLSQQPTDSNDDDCYDNYDDNHYEHVGYPEKFVKGAARCDGGGKKNPILLPMIREGLIIVTRLNLIEAQNRIQIMTDQILERTKLFGLTIQVGPRAAHILGLRPSPTLKHVLTPKKMVYICHQLASRNVYIAVRGGAFRIAPYLNTRQCEIDMLVNALQDELHALL
mmetsp:Transcript_7083/g.10150  ORF Transcript_7083/g.10150 Transcript_7083/m.10150 type:complete len:419 (+) Transcript_7083:447-1703(+)